MVTWFSPFDLPAPVVERLGRAGATPVSSQGLNQATAGSQLLLYRAPHQIGQTAQGIREGYQQLDDLAKRGLGQLWNAERLQRLSPDQWGGAWEPGNTNDIGTEIEPDPLDALVALGVIREDPELLDAYLDLELRGVLGGEEPDTAYLERLRRASSGEKLEQGLHQLQRLKSLEIRLRMGELVQPDVLPELRLQLVNSDTEVNLLRKELVQYQLQLQQGQVELENLFLSDRDNRSRLATYEAERETNRQAVSLAQSQLATVEAEWRASLAANEDTLNQERQALAALRSQLTQGETKLEDTRRTVEDLRNALAAAEAEHQKELTTAQGQIGTLEIQLRASQNGYENQLAIERQSLVDTLGRLAECETSLAERDSFLANERQTVVDQAQKLAAKEESLQALAEVHNQTQTSLSEAEMARDRAQSEAVQLDKALRERTTAGHRQESQLAMARQESERLGLEIQQQKTFVLQLQRELQQSKGSMERREGQLAAARAQLADAQLNLATCLNRVSAAVQEKESSQQECFRLNNELDESQDQLRHSGQRIVELETDLATGKQQSSQLEIKINELQTQLQDRTENLHQLQHQETDLRKQIDENTQAITTLETVLGSHQQELEHWRQKTLDLIQNLTATQGELAQKDHQLQEMVQRQQAMQGHFDQLQSDWNASESGYARSIQEAQQVTVEVRQAHHAVEEELDRHRQELLRKHDALEQNQQALALSQDETKDQRHQVLEQQNLAAAQLQQLRRASALLWRLSNIKGVPGTGSAVPTLQLLALLEGYRHSLKRAERLLRGG